jgi:toxin HigB-1
MEAMEFEFANKHLQKLYEKESYAVKELGISCARKLKARFSDIQAVNKVTELIAGDPHPLLGKRKGQFSIALGGGNCIMFVPTNRPTPLIGKDKIDWSQVTKIEIIEIGDYHD